MELLNSLSLRSRQAKLALFRELICPSVEELILFLGAGLEYAPELRQQLSDANENVFIVGVGNTERIILADIDLTAIGVAKQRWPSAMFLCCDGRALPFLNRSVPVVFSNATIEHVGPRSDQEQFAKEVQRVGHRWFVTTPNFYFPFEFHYRLPFIHYFPKPVQRRLKDYVGGRYSRRKMPRIWLLTPQAMQQLFPDGHIILNRVTIFPETIIAWGNSETGRSELPNWRA